MCFLKFDIKIEIGVKIESNAGLGLAKYIFSIATQPFCLYLVSIPIQTKF